MASCGLRICLLTAVSQPILLRGLAAASAFVPMAIRTTADRSKDRLTILLCVAALRCAARVVVPALRSSAPLRSTSCRFWWLTGRHRPIECVGEALGTRVDLYRSRQGGRLVIHFYSEEDLQGLYDRLVDEA